MGAFDDILRPAAAPAAGGLFDDIVRAKAPSRPPMPAPEIAGGPASPEESTALPTTPEAGMPPVQPTDTTPPPGPMPEDMNERIRQIATIPAKPVKSVMEGYTPGAAPVSVAGTAPTGMGAIDSRFDRPDVTDEGFAGKPGVKSVTGKTPQSGLEEGLTIKAIGDDYVQRQRQEQQLKKDNARMNAERKKRGQAPHEIPVIGKRDPEQIEREQLANEYVSKNADRIKAIDDQLSAGMEVDKQPRYRPTPDAPDWVKSTMAGALGITSGTGDVLRAFADMSDQPADVLADYNPYFRANILAVGALGKLVLDKGKDGRYVSPKWVTEHRDLQEALTPGVNRLSSAEAWDRGAFGDWLLSNVVGQAPQLGLMTLGMVVPAAMPAVLTLLGGQSMAQQYDENLKRGASVPDAFNDAAVTGGIEVISTYAFTKILKLMSPMTQAFLNKMPADARMSMGKTITREILAKAGATLATTGEEVTEETLTQFLQNLSHKYIGKNEKQDLTEGLLDTGIITAPIGLAFALAHLPHLAHNARGNVAEARLNKAMQQIAEPGMDLTERSRILREAVTEAQEIDPKATRSKLMQIASAVNAEKEKEDAKKAMAAEAGTTVEEISDEDLAAQLASQGIVPQTTAGGEQAGTGQATGPGNVPGESQGAGTAATQGAATAVAPTTGTVDADAEVQSVREALNRRFEAFGSDTVLPAGSVRVVDPPKRDRPFADAVKALFGTEIVWLDSGGVDLGGEGFALPGLDNKIFIPVGSTDPLAFTAGHEVWHTIEQKHADLAKRMVDMLRAEGFDLEKALVLHADSQVLPIEGETAEQHAARVADMRAYFMEDVGGRGWTRIEGEMAGDFVGRRWHDKKFWEGLAKKDKTAFAKAAKVVLDWFDGLLAKLKATPGNSEWVKETQRLKDEAVSMIHEVAQRYHKELAAKLTAEKVKGDQRKKKAAADKKKTEPKTEPAEKKAAPAEKKKAAKTDATPTAVKGGNARDLFSTVPELTKLDYKSKDKLIDMPIEDFLGMAEPQPEGPTKVKEVRVAKILRENGTFTNVPYLNFKTDGTTATVTGHEGRHRARALRALGYTHIPVLLKGDIRWSEQNNMAFVDAKTGKADRGMDYREEWPTTLKGQDGKTTIEFPVTREEASGDYGAAPPPKKTTAVEKAVEKQAAAAKTKAKVAADVKAKSKRAKKAKAEPAAEEPPAEETKRDKQKRAAAEIMLRINDLTFQNVERELKPGEVREIATAALAQQAIDKNEHADVIDALRTMDPVEALGELQSYVLATAGDIKASPRRTEPTNIEDGDALAQMAKIEGPGWAAQQKVASGPYSFNAVRNAVIEAKKIKSEHPDSFADSTVREMASDLVGSGGLVIYGAGGYNRYTIDGTGRITPLPESFSSVGKFEAARTTLGLDVDVQIVASPRRGPETETPEFKAAFAESKVRDENGDIIPLFHGTTNDIKEFKQSHDGSLGAGTYLTPHPSFASTYAEGDGGNVLKVYANLRNPMIIESGNRDPMMVALQQLGMTPEKAEALVEKAYEEKGYVSTQVKSRAEKAGYDGIMQYRDGVLREVVAWDKNKIKGFANRGTWKMFTGDILASPRRAGKTDDTISPRNPTAKNRLEDPLGKNVRLQIGHVSLQYNPVAYAHNVGLMARYPNFRHLTGTPEVVAKQILDHMVSNLLWLYDKVPPHIRKRSMLWYVGANRMSVAMAKRYKMERRGVAGVMAVLSPQKDWFMNASLAERVLDTITQQQNTRWTPQMARVANRIYKKPQYRKMLNNIRGKTLGELKHADEKAAWVRAYDEAHNSRYYHVIHPEGTRGDFAMTKPKGKKGITRPKRVAWGSLGSIAKAIEIYENPSRENISRQLGNEHKVRSFYNNILEPDSQLGHVTIDTHAVAAALLRALSGESTEVKHNFGSNQKGRPGPMNSSLTGVSGLYGMYAEAYRMAALRRGVLPREMQSVTWEAVRGLFEETFKSQRANVTAVNQVWSDYSAGKVKLNEARKRIYELGGKITDPDWVGGQPGRPYLGRDEAARRTTDTGMVSRARVPGGAASRVAGRGRGTAAVAVPEILASPKREDMQSIKEEYQAEAADILRSYGYTDPEIEQLGKIDKAKVAKAIARVQKKNNIYGDEQIDYQSAQDFLNALSSGETPNLPPQGGPSTASLAAAGYNEAQSKVIYESIEHVLAMDYGSPQPLTAKEALAVAGYGDAQIEQMYAPHQPYAGTPDYLTPPPGAPTVEQLQSVGYSKKQIAQLYADMKAQPEKKPQQGQKPKELAQPGDVLVLNKNSNEAVVVKSLSNLQNMGYGFEDILMYADDKADELRDAGYDNADINKHLKELDAYIYNEDGVPPEHQYGVTEEPGYKGPGKAIKTAKPVALKPKAKPNEPYVDEADLIPPPDAPPIEFLKNSGYSNAQIKQLYDDLEPEPVAPPGAVVSVEDLKSLHYTNKQIVDFYKESETENAADLQAATEYMQQHLAESAEPDTGAITPEGYPPAFETPDPTNPYPHPVFIDANDDYTPKGITAAWDDDSMVDYVVDANGDVHVFSMNMEEGRDPVEVLNWLAHEYSGNKVTAVDVRPISFKFWNDMKKAGVITDWTQVPYKEQTYVKQPPEVSTPLVGKAGKQQLSGGDLDAAIKAEVAKKDEIKRARDEGLLMRLKRIATDAFKIWFGSSKVTEADGTPMLMYTGTARDVSVFRPGQADAMYASPDANFAYQFAHSSLNWMRSTFMPKNADEREQQRWAAPTIYPVYVRAENPFDYAIPKHRKILEAVLKRDNVDHEGNLTVTDHRGNTKTYFIDKVMKEIKDGNWVFIEAPEIQPIIRSLGHDGFWMKEDHRRNIGVYDPNQMKGLNNPGKWSRTQNDLLASPRRVTGGRNPNFPSTARFPVEEQTKMAQKERLLVDRFNRVKQIQNIVFEAGGNINDRNNVYLALERYPGRTDDRTKQFKRNILQPIIDDAAKAGVKLKDVIEYLYAVHAPIRNAQIAKINPKMPDGGSGITNLDAANQLAAWQQDANFTNIKAIADRLQGITKMTADLLVNEGIIEPHVRQNWINAYGDTYIPLRGDGRDVFDEDFGDEKAVGSARNRGMVDARGNKVERATGRHKPADAQQIMGNIVNDHISAIERSERGQIGKRLMQMVIDNPDPDLWEIDAARFEDRIDAKTGKVKRFFYDDRDLDSTVVVRVAGKEYVVKIKDPELARQLLNANDQGMDDFIGGMGKFNQTLTQLWTQYNPIFAAVNFNRDFWAGGTHMLAEHGVKAAAKMMAGIPGAIRAMYREERGKDAAGGGVWQQYAREFQANGGRTGYLDFLTVQQRVDEINHLYRMAAGTGSTVMIEKAGRAVASLISHMNGAVENGIRLSAYRTLREQGMSPEQAASAAKNLTVNFNKRGDLGPKLNALYLFYNPSMQSGVRIASAFKKSPKAMAGIASSMVGLGMIAALLGSLDEDDDGVSYWDKPQFEQAKQNNLVIIIPGSGGQALLLPSAYGYHAFFALGYGIVDLLRGRKRTTTVAANVMSAIAQGFVPIGGNVAQQGAVGLFPTALQPGINIISGKGAFGQNLYPGQESMPDSARFRPQTRGTPAQVATQWLNEATGGNQYESGWIDVSPETVNYVASFVTGGVGTAILDLLNIGSQSLKGGVGEADWDRFPLIKQFYRQHKPERDAQLFYERLTDLKQAVSAHNAFIEAGNMEAAARITDKYGEGLIITLGGALADFQSSLKGIRDQQAAITDSEDLDGAEKMSQLRELDRQKGLVFQQFNKLFTEHNDGRIEMPRPPHIL